MDNKKRIIIGVGVCAALLICFGAVGLCSSRESARQSGDAGAVERYSRRAAESASDDAAGKTSGRTQRRFAVLEVTKIPASLASQEKNYTGFRVSFNRENGTPNWVGWELLGKETSGEASRSNKFWQDADLEGCPASSDYSRSGFDRGHLCPAADQKWSREAMEDCFVMANMAPQDHALNTGAWNTLENKERVWAKRDSAIVIVAGPVYEKGDSQRIGRAGVRVPGAFFKVILAPYVEKPRAIGFVFPNMTAPGNMVNYAMSVREVENLTGFDFFSGLPDELENDVESNFSFHDWND